MRKAILWFIGAGVLSVSAATMVVGCGSDAAPPTGTSRPAAADLKEGLTVISAAPGTLHAAYKANGRIVYFQSVTGPAKPDGYKQEFPDEPAFEMDQRFVDQEGRTFKLQIGGDNLIDPTWAADMAKGKQLAPPTREQREADFLLSREAGAALRAGGLGPEHADHIYHLTNLGNHVPMEMPKLVARATELRTVNAPEPVPASERAYNNTSYWNWWEGDLYGKCIYLCVGHHSATIGWNYSNNTATWDEEVVSCNHGTCATDSSMGYQGYNNPTGSACSGGKGWVPNYKDVANGWSEETSTVNQGYTGNYGCQSNYNWNTPPGHLCNDDSFYQMWQIKDACNYGRGSTHAGNGTSFNANDTNGHNYMCSCSNCSGDWSIPAVP